MENKDKVKIEKLEAQIAFMQETKILLLFNDYFDDVLEFYKEHFAKDKNKSYIMLAYEFANFINEVMIAKKITPEDVSRMGLAYFFRGEMQIRVNKFLSSLGRDFFSWDYERAEYGMDGIHILANFRSGLSAEYCKDFLKGVDLSKADNFTRKAIEFLRG